MPEQLDGLAKAFRKRAEPLATQLLARLGEQVAVLDGRRGLKALFDARKPAASMTAKVR